MGTYTQHISIEPAFILGLICLIGLLALRRPINRIVTGTLKPVLGYFMLGAGGELIITNLQPLGWMMEHGFHITPVVPNNEAVLAIAQDLLGMETLLTLLILGFVSSFIGGLMGMIVLGVMGDVLILPGLVAQFFTGATAGIYGNATGGRRGAILGGLLNGLGITLLPALLLPELGYLGQQYTTFGDVDFGILGVLLGKAEGIFGSAGVYGMMALLALILILGRNQKKGGI